MGRMFNRKIKSDSAVDTTCVTDPTVHEITKEEYNKLSDQERKDKIFKITDDSSYRGLFRRKNNEIESTKELQQTLNFCGYDLSVDGYFGNNTASALRDFQRSHHGLKITGEVDQDTWYALSDERYKLDNSVPVTMATYLDLTDDDIKDSMYIITDRTRDGRKFTAKGKYVTEYFRGNNGLWKTEVHDRSKYYNTTTWNDYPHLTTSSSNQYTVIANPDIGYSDNTISDGFDDLRKELEEMKRRMNTKVSLIHNCANCGAQLEVDENKPIFHCKYCGSTYIIGAQQVNATY